MNQLDNHYMERAFELAKLGIGKVSPNPMVGCVIVHDNKIIGEGWHKQYGGPHAEVNAINSVLDKSLLHNATAYVTLEPCAHHGKTPPCADLLVSHQLKRVVIANKDPFPLVNGGGINKLKSAGILTQVGTMQEKGRELNRRFFSSIEQKRPYIIMKWAQTSDGFIARENFDSKWISNSYSRKLVHKWRAEEDAILVGTNTAKYDNPSLTVRDWDGKNPLRLIIDKNLKLNPDISLFDKSTPTICYNFLKNEESENLTFVKLAPENIIEQILSDLNDRKVQSLIVEGGSSLLKSFIEKKMWDEARVFTSQKTFEKGVMAPHVMGSSIKNENVKGDQLNYIQNLIS